LAYGYQRARSNVCLLAQYIHIECTVAEREKKEEKGIKETISIVIIHTIQIQLSHYNE